MSRAPFASLNSSFAVGDDAAAVTHNLALLAGAAGVEPARLITAKQVHGARVVHASEVDATTEADAVWTATTGVAVGVRTADCLPVLLEDPRTGAVAAVHAGWRGVISEIVTRAVEQLEGQGARRDELRAAIGPCIQRCCFEVDGDLPERFVAAFGPTVLVGGGEGQKARLDLPRAVVSSLGRAGLVADHVGVLPHCTRCDPRFFSHRRDQGVTGRMLSFITCGRAADL